MNHDEQRDRMRQYAERTGHSVEYHDGGADSVMIEHHEMKKHHEKKMDVKTQPNLRNQPKRI